MRYQYLERELEGQGRPVIVPVLRDLQERRDIVSPREIDQTVAALELEDFGLARWDFNTLERAYGFLTSDRFTFDESGELRDVMVAVCSLLEHVLETATAKGLWQPDFDEEGA